MKRYLLSMAFLAAVTVLHAQPPAGDANVGDNYGASTSKDGAVKAKKLPALLKKDSVLQTKVVGKVLEVCPKKGCWMKLELNDKTTATVKMKGYAFFVPTALEGKTVVIDGKAELVTTSVAELKHIAEDGKKPQAEIDAITEPKQEVKILANGITVVK